MTFYPNWFCFFKIITFTLQKLIGNKSLIYISYIIKPISSLFILWNLLWEGLWVLLIELKLVNNPKTEIFRNLLSLFDGILSTNSKTFSEILKLSIWKLKPRIHSQTFRDFGEFMRIYRPINVLTMAKKPKFVDFLSSCFSFFKQLNKAIFHFWFLTKNILSPDFSYFYYMAFYVLLAVDSISQHFCCNIEYLSSSILTDRFKGSVFWIL